MNTYTFVNSWNVSGNTKKLWNFKGQKGIRELFFPIWNYVFNCSKLSIFLLWTKAFVFFGRLQEYKTMNLRKNSLASLSPHPLVNFCFWKQSRWCRSLRFPLWRTYWLLLLCTVIWSLTKMCVKQACPPTSEPTQQSFSNSRFFSRLFCLLLISSWYPEEKNP